MIDVIRAYLDRLGCRYINDGPNIVVIPSVRIGVFITFSPVDGHVIYRREGVPVAVVFTPDESFTVSVLSKPKLAGIDYTAELCMTDLQEVSFGQDYILFRAKLDSGAEVSVHIYR